MALDTWALMFARRRVWFWHRLYVGTGHVYEWVGRRQDRAYDYLVELEALS
jgi:hypothetical protein